MLQLAELARQGSGGSPGCRGASAVAGRNIGDDYYGVNTIANFRDLDVLAAEPVVADLSGVFDRYWNSASTVPIATIVAHAHGAADLDAILARLRQEIAAANSPYPIDQDLGELAAQSAELRDSLVWAPGRIIADDPEAIAGGKPADDVVAFIRGRVAELKEGLLAAAPYFVLPTGAQATIKALHERSVRVRVLTNSLASNNQLAAHSCYAKTRSRLLESGMELYELRPDTDAFRPGWSLRSGQSRAALHTKAMVFDRKAVFIGSFNLDPRSAVINTEAGLYIESPELGERPTAYMETGVAPANSYRVFLDPKGGIVWETVRDGEIVSYRDEPETGFRRRFVADLVKLLPIDSQVDTDRFATACRLRSRCWMGRRRRDGLNPPSYTLYPAPPRRPRPLGLPACSACASPPRSRARPLATSPTSMPWACSVEMNECLALCGVTYGSASRLKGGSQNRMRKFW